MRVDAKRQAELEAMLRETLEDHRLSRSEARSIREVADDLRGEAEAIGFLRNRAFEMATEAVRAHPEETVGWLRRVDRILDAAAVPDPGIESEDRVAFAPGQACLKLIQSALRSARKTLDICVFTITDDRISDGIISAHRRGVAVRVISDDEKQDDRGSDVDRLRKAGIPVREDASQDHMHHKFAVVDGRVLLNGSYNWTRGATDNHENIHATTNPEVVDRFHEHFERLWRAMG